MEFKDYYRTLGVEKDATDEDIKRAFRKLARQYHPDVNPNDKAAETRFKEINEAHEVLADPASRRKYDELGADWRRFADQPPPGRPGAGFRTMTRDDAEALFGGGGFSDFFQAFFTDGGQPARGRRSARRGHDLEAEVELTLEEAFAGTTRRLRVPRSSGDASVEVRVPAGVADGARVRAAGEGASGRGGAESGDLLLRVRVRPHQRFERRGADLHTRVAVPITTAVLGGEVPVPTLSGSTLRLRIPEMTRAGRVFRLRGHGMPSPGRPAERGDLYATVDIDIPAALSADARRHYEALRALGESS
jgi:curved DNA-binding protein